MDHPAIAALFSFIAVNLGLGVLGRLWYHRRYGVGSRQYRDALVRGLVFWAIMLIIAAAYTFATYTQTK